jgi:hypothetical protein
LFVFIISFFLSSSAAAKIPIFSQKSDRYNTAHFPINYGADEFKRISFNEQAAFDLVAANRTQQAYFLETGKFANYEQLVELGLLESDRYKIVTENNNNNNSAFIYAIPQKDYATYKVWSGLSWIDALEPLYGYVSGIEYSKDRNSFQTILCVSKIVGESKLQEPEIIAGKFACAEGTEEIP